MDIIKETRYTSDQPYTRITKRRARLPEHSIELWNLINDAGPSVANVTRLTSRFTGQFNTEAWRRSIFLLLRRHTILNARMLTGADGLELIAEEELDDPLTLVDFSICRVAEPQTQLAELAGSMTWQPFHPDGPLFRAFLISVSESENVLGIVVQHFLADAWSMRIVGRELVSAYYAACAGEVATLPEQKISYLEYLEWMNRWRESPEAQSQVAYWTGKLADAPVVNLPVESGVDFDAYGLCVEERFLIDPPIVSRLCDRAKGLHFTPFLLLLTANIAALSVVTTSREIVTSVLTDGRGDLRLRNMVGLVTNQLRIRAVINSHDTFEQLAKRVQATYVAALANATYPHALIDAHMGRSKLQYPAFHFRRLVGQQSRSDQNHTGFEFFQIPSPPPARIRVGHGSNPGLLIEHVGESMVGALYYLPELHRRETALRFVDVFCKAVMIAANGSNHPLCAELQD